MFLGNVLNSDAQLNNYTKLNAINFVPGSSFKFVFQIINDQTNLRHVPGPDSIVKLYVNNVDGQRTELTTQTFEGDRSIRFVDISSEVSATLNGGNLSFRIDDDGTGTHIEIGLITNGLTKQIESGLSNGCC